MGPIVKAVQAAVADQSDLWESKLPAKLADSHFLNQVTSATRDSVRSTTFRYLREKGRSIAFAATGVW